jgi:uncharacterized protein YcnI
MNHTLRNRLAPAAFGLAAAALLALATGTASAHVVLEYPVALAGASYKATFKVGHGCGTSATRQISVVIPAGVQGAKPMPKAGWALEVTRAPLAKPYKDHGRNVTEDVVRITWTAKTPDDYLPNAYYDEFSLQAKLPGTAAPLYWPVSQVCVEGRMDWTDVPAAGQPMQTLKSPAALLELMPAEGGGAHNH